MHIGSRKVGQGCEPYVIAEIGVNHDGEVARALELTKAAAGAGADAVKLQYFETDRLMSKAAKLAAYQRAAGETDPIEMLRRLELSLEECGQVIDHAHGLGIHAIVTLFSLETVDKTLELPWDAIKTASPDLVNYPLLRALKADGRPMIVSTGAASQLEVQCAYHGVLEDLMPNIALLHCVSCYPTPREKAAISGLLGLDAELVFQASGVGYSDHTSEIDTGALAVQIGASYLEKHLTYDRTAAGPDHAASLEPAQLGEYIRLVRAESGYGEWYDYFERILTDEGEEKLAEHMQQDPAYGFVAERTDDGGWLFMPCKRVQDIERDVRRVSRQSVVATRDIRKGKTITREMVTIKRPCDGTIPAADLDYVVGQRALVDVEGDLPLPIEAVAESEDMPSYLNVEPWDWGDWDDAP